MRTLLVALFVLTPLVVDAQVRPGTTTPRRPGVVRDTSPRLPNDTLRPGRDTTGQRPLVQWPSDDSVAENLLQRAGLIGTRYQADEVIFQAQGRAIVLNGNAAVQRDQSIIVSDTIIYSDSTKIVLALGDTAILRDPAQGPADVIALGRIAYDIENRRGAVTNVSTSVESGEIWYLNARRSFFQGDSANVAEQRFYARNGTLTSCSDPNPDYYFRAKEIKLVQKRLLVARPAVLYIKDVPVAWLPFIFQDLRGGRRSGILPPRIGVSDIVRNNPTYERRIENIGYYWAINDYLDAQASMDWWSGIRSGNGRVQSRASLTYNWLDRFMSGGFDVGRYSTRFGRSETYSWRHFQNFSQSSSFSANLNYARNASVVRSAQTNPYAALASINSQANYQTRFGPATLSLGGSRSEQLGGQTTTNLPTLNLSTGTIELREGLSWTPSLSFSNELRTRYPVASDQRFLGTVFSSERDTTLRLGAARVSRLSFGTPFNIGGFQLPISVDAQELTNNVPTIHRTVVDGDTVTRVFARQFEQGLDFTFGFSLPQIAPGTWKLTPSVSLQNTVPGRFFIANEVTGGRFVHQTKRATYGLSAAPTFFGLFRGFGPFARFRHAINPTINYSFAPKGRVSNEYLEATGTSNRIDLSALRQNSLTFGLSTNLEGKMRSTTDSAGEESGERVKIVSINFSSFSYNFEQLRELQKRARAAGSPSPRWTAGLTTSTFSYSLTSDLVPGATFSSTYSLFEGDARTDTARFSPFLEGIEASFQLNRRSSIFALLNRVFGRPVKNETPQVDRPDPRIEDAEAQRLAARPGFGSTARRADFPIPDARQGWTASLSFSHNQSRPVASGATVFDPTAICRDVLDPFQRDFCEQQQLNKDVDVLPGSSASRQIFRTPKRTNLNASTSFAITPTWGTQWSTNYDFVRGAFGSQTVSLRRALHDWDLVFGFTKTPSGAFSFTAFISLRAQPDLKFDYRKAEVR